MGLILLRWGIMLPRIPPPRGQQGPQPLFFTQPSHIPFRDMYTCVYKKTQSPTQNPPFPGLNLKVGKMNVLWAIWTPSGQKVWKVGNFFLEVGKNNLFIYIKHDIKETRVHITIRFKMPVMSLYTKIHMRHTIQLSLVLMIWQKTLKYSI